MLTQGFLLSIISFISNSSKGKIMEIFSLLLGDGVVRGVLGNKCAGHHNLKTVARSLSVSFFIEKEPHSSQE
jgi:hypothetical protein